MKRIKHLALPIVLIAALVACEKEKLPVLEVQEELVVSCEADTLNVPVACSATCKAAITYDQEAQSGWLLMLPRVLYKDGYLTFFINNYDAVLADRSATVTLTCGDLTKSLKITQKAKDGISLSTRIYTAPKNGGSLTVTVGANTNWTATVEKGSDWLTVDVNSGDQGEDPLKVSFAKVSGIGDYDMRVGKVCVTTGAKTEYLSIYQGFGVIINGLRWAECNVGEFRTFSSSPDDVGCMYQFNSDKAWPGTGAAAPSGYQGGWVDCGHSSWEPEKDPSPEGWRLPTMQEFEALIGYDIGEKKYVWLDPSTSGFSIPGAVVGVSRNQLEGATAADLKGGIFIPQSGYRAGGSGSGELVDVERVAVQTNTTPNHNWDRYVYCLGASDWGKSWGDWEIKACVRSAFPIRCVAPIPE